MSCLFFCLFFSMIKEEFYKKKQLSRVAFMLFRKNDYFLKPSSAIIALYLVISFFLR